jgi:hypothetical protein
MYCNASMSTSSSERSSKLPTAEAELFELRPESNPEECAEEWPDEAALLVA